MSGIVEKHKKGIVIRVRISPNSSSCSVNGIMTAADGAKMLKISVNAELIEFIAKRVRLPRSDIEIIGGETERVKRLLLYGKVKELEEKLFNWLGDMTDDR